MIVEEIKRAVFLDRDGTISSDELGYNSDPDKYHLYPYTGEALRLIQSLGYLLIIVTNQSGIARSYFTIEQLNTVHDRMKELLLAEGVFLDAVYFSPYWKDGIVEPYNVAHEDRKPGIGMYRTAKQDFGFNTAQSWMIGDRYTDVAFGRKAGLKTVLLLSGNGREELDTAFEREYKPHFIADNLLTAAKLIELSHTKLPGFTK
ncbi:MAG: HAD family hydrolase [Candidatus Cloacimonetes bacterium HGW-Cloacimonetes-2]|nr:MAG: HAD family hydrolase [Candidatus Cloacimonetes bacterium HGW-Cloacimonetes-2]